MEDKDILNNIKIFVQHYKVPIAMILFLLAVISFFQLGHNLGEITYYIKH